MATDVHKAASAVKQGRQLWSEKMRVQTKIAEVKSKAETTIGELQAEFDAVHVDITAALSDPDVSQESKDGAKLRKDECSTELTSLTTKKDELVRMSEGFAVDLTSSVDLDGTDAVRDKVNALRKDVLDVQAKVGGFYSSQPSPNSPPLP